MDMTNIKIIANMKKGLASTPQVAFQKFSNDPIAPRAHSNQTKPHSR